jgi:pimeloyl-ACP methyl ester carboxylesterase
MRYFTWGSGSPIVFIHGMADAASAFVMVMHQLFERHTCIAYELPDGTTDGSILGQYTHTDYADDLLELLDHLSLARVAVMGSSFGSTIALEALSRRSERFTHGILQGSFAHRPLNFLQRCLCRSARYWRGWSGDWPAIFRIVLQQIEQQTFARLTPQVKKFLLDNGGRTPLQAAAMRSLMIDQIDLRPLLPSIQTPVLMIGGDNDSLVPRVCEYEIARSSPNVKRIEFSGCGHYPHYTHPIPMAEVMKIFLDNAEAINPLKPTGFRP